MKSKIALSIKIRKAGRADAQAIAQFAEELGYPTNPADVEDRLEEILQQSHHRVLIAEADGDTVVGWIHVFSTAKLTAGSFVEIGGLVVTESHRSHGIGRLLLAEAEKWAQTQGIQSMRVHSQSFRERAHQFYERQGYSQIKTQHVFQKALHNRT